MDKETLKGIGAILFLLLANWVGTWLEIHLPC